MFLQRVPRLLKWIFSLVLFFLLLMMASRFVFFLAYNPPGRAVSGSAFIWGFRYDLRYAAMLGLATMALCAFPFLDPIKRFSAKKFWNILLTLVFFLLLILYVTDFYYYDYRQTRLNASVIDLAQEGETSGKMVWQTYPVIRIVLFMIALTIAVRFVLGRLINRFQTQPGNTGKAGAGFYILAFLILGQSIVGKIILRQGQFPLRWSDAYEIGDNYKANLALNPLQSFFSTLSYRGSKPDLEKTKAVYPLMAAWLGVDNPDSTALNYDRFYKGNDSIKTHPNIVLVICESFSAYKSSMWGNPLNTTPFFNQLCREGAFFDHCFTPSYGTARGVWSTVTGIPDVESPNTASRNSANVDQRTIINQFNGYEKFYFIGGSTSWANLRGLLTNNIDGLHLYEQDDYKAKPVDVWGISDRQLFSEANDVLKAQQKPFFAIIQTADNHRPYTIPKADRGDFKFVTYPGDSLYRYGFQSNEELNAFRFTDFCYQKFIETAKQEKYFDNTIFVFVGDHGIRGSAGSMLPKAYTDQNLVSEHVPLLFYAPKLISPQRNSFACSQIDVLPSIASVAGIPCHNYTMGRCNIFDSISLHNPGNQAAFIIDPDEHTIGIIHSGHYYRKNLSTGKETFVSIVNNDPVLSSPETEREKKQLSELAEAYYETSKYMLKFNKKQTDRP